MMHVFGPILRFLVAAIVSLTVATWVVLLVITRGGAGIADPQLCKTDAILSSSLSDVYRAWLHDFLVASDANTWSCATYPQVLEQIKNSGLTMMAVMFLVMVVVVGSVWVEQRHVRRQRGFFSDLFLALGMAPTFVWASLIMVISNLVIVALLGWWPALDFRYWMFPAAVEPLRFAAAILALTVGAGMLMDLKNGLRDDLAQVLSSDYVVSARVNGLAVAPRVIRNLMVPFFTRLLSKFPMLVGEVIVVEYVFVLDGVGRQVMTLTELRDAPALITLTFLFVLTRQLLRGGVQVMAQALHA